MDNFSTKDDSDYGISARSYLHRARERILENSKPSLFYAAYELRCCVEARQAEYLEHLEVYKGQKFKAYKIGENRKKIAKISDGKVIAKINWQFEDGQHFVAYHTPVPSDLVKYCEKSLDRLRHSQLEIRSNDSRWWSETRKALINHYRIAWISCQGKLLVPPLWGATNKQFHPLVVEFEEAERKVMEQITAAIGVPMILNVEYLENPPNDWICDL